MLMKFFCTKCGAPIEADNSVRDFIFCTHCGSKETVPNSAPGASAVNSAPVQYNPQPPRPSINRPAAPTEIPNLVINYVSINPAVQMFVKITETNLLYRFPSGMSAAFLMSQGQHILILKIGKKNYKRAIFINPSERPVTIHASWDGRARINIDQPFFQPFPQQYQPMPQQPYPPQQYNPQTQFAPQQSFATPQPPRQNFASQPQPQQNTPSQKVERPEQATREIHVEPESNNGAE